MAPAHVSLIELEVDDVTLIFAPQLFAATSVYDLATPAATFAGSRLSKGAGSIAAPRDTKRVRRS